jgi:hypothetical protein
VTEIDARWRGGKKKLQHFQNFVLLHSKKKCFILIFLSVDGVLLYGELLLKKAAIYGRETFGLKLHKDINLLG